MKFQAKLIRMFRRRIHKHQVNDGKYSDTPDDENVTKEIAKKIIDDARIHRLAITEDFEKDT